MAVAALTLRINVEYGLDVVIARRQLRQTVDGMPEGCLIYDDGLSRRKIFGVHAEDRRRIRPDLQTRLGTIRAGDDQDDAARERLRLNGPIDSNLELCFRPDNQTEQNL